MGWRDHAAFFGCIFSLDHAGSREYLQVPYRHPVSSPEAQATSGMPAGCSTGGWRPLGAWGSAGSAKPQPSPTGSVNAGLQAGIGCLHAGRTAPATYITVACPALCPATWGLLTSFPRPLRNLASPIWRGAFQLGEVCILAGLTEGWVSPWSVPLAESCVSC